MFDLDAAVRAWKEALASERSLAGADLDELEDHVRCKVETLMSRGVDEERAWTAARDTIGAPEELSAEFRKVGGGAWRMLVRVGWVLFAAAFFLPVHRYGLSHVDLKVDSGVLPGIEAFLVALKSGPAGAVSALTNFVMLLTMWRISARGRPWVLALTLTMWAATCLNAWWMVDADPITDLRLGYFLWWTSFGVVSTGLALRVRSAAPHAETATAA